MFGVKPTGYEAARDAEKAELDRERIRLWYVAATRARELLVLPRLDVTAKRSAWISLLDLSLAELPALDLSHLPPEIGACIGQAQKRADPRDLCRGSRGDRQTPAAHRLARAQPRREVRPSRRCTLRCCQRFR